MPKIFKNIGLKGGQINGATMPPVGRAPDDFYLQGLFTFYVTFRPYIFKIYILSLPLRKTNLLYSYFI
jgi:hypothetical protein